MVLDSLEYNVVKAAHETSLALVLLWHGGSFVFYLVKFITEVNLVQLDKLGFVKDPESQIESYVAHISMLSQDYLGLRNTYSRRWEC